jgi:hypothetical protein
VGGYLKPGILAENSTQRDGTTNAAAPSSIAASVTVFPRGIALKEGTRSAAEFSQSDP